MRPRHVVAFGKNGGEAKLHQLFVDIEPVRGALDAGKFVLTPGRRLARQLTDAWLLLQQSTSSVVDNPRIEPVDAWLESQWLKAIESGQLPPQKLLSRLEERLVWLSIISTDDEYGEAFRLLQPQTAAEHARLCRDAILHFGPNNSHALLRDHMRSDMDCQAFYAWLERFDSVLSARGWATRADAYQQLTQLHVGVKSEVYLAHMLDVTPLTWRVLNHLATVGTTTQLTSMVSRAPVEGVCFESVEDELSHIAAWAAKRHREGRHSTAIVLLNFKRDRPLLEYYLRREFGCLDARYDRLPVNFATGQPLASAPLFRDALLALTLHTEPLTRQRMLALLRSPYLLEPNFHESEEAIALIKSLFNLGTDPIEWSDFSHCVALHAPQSSLAQRIAALQTSPQRIETHDLVSWVERLRALLEQWQWPSRPALDSMEYQQLDRFERSFDQLISLNEVAGEIDYQRAVSLWRSCLDDMVFQPKTEASALQVLGPQEAVGLRFDALHICGLQAGTLPAKPRLLPFIPPVLQHQWAMPNADSSRLLTQAQQLISSWRGTHAEVSGSCYGWSEGVEQRPSTLFAVQASLKPDMPVRPKHWRTAAKLECINDASTEGRVDGPDVPFGGGASVLQNQSACAFRAWVRHRLGAMPLAETTFGLTAAERGSAVHYALYYFWGRVTGSAQLKALSDDARSALISDSVDEAIRTLEQRNKHGSLRKRVGSACLDIEANRLRLLVAEWLNHERKREVEYVVVEREQRHVLRIGDLELHLQPDRIDALQDGRRLVIDYKTGRPSRSSWLSDRPADPQLPLYALLNAEVQGLAFARVRREDVGFVELGDDLGLRAREQTLVDQLKGSQSPLSDWPALAKHWRCVLESLAYAYARGDATINPTPGACLYCDLGAVCRERHQYTGGSTVGGSLERADDD